jgi:hypothetical protein
LCKVCFNAKQIRGDSFKKFFRVTATFIPSYSLIARNQTSKECHGLSLLGPQRYGKLMREDLVSAFKPRIESHASNVNREAQR